MFKTAGNKAMNDSIALIYEYVFAAQKSALTNTVEMPQAHIEPHILKWSIVSLISG